MTTETEKQFFEVFGIGETNEIDLLKPEYANQSVCKKCEKNKYCADYCDEAYEAYPEITDRILLELIVLLSKIMILKYHKFNNINELKENILTKCIYYNEDISNEVRKLFGVEDKDE